MKAFAKKAGQDIDDVIDSVNDIETAFKGIKAPTTEIDKLGKSFDSTSRLAKKSVDEQKKEKALPITRYGTKSRPKEYEALENDLKANITEANKLEKALTEIEGAYSVDVDIDVPDESSN